MTETREKIKATIEEITRLDSAKKHFDVLQNSLISMKEELSQKTLQLSKEHDDIEKLEKLGITSLFYKVLGNKEEQLEKERQEYLALALKIKELKTSIELTEYEASVIEQKANNVNRLKEDLKGLMESRKQEILMQNDEVRNSLLSVLNEQDNCHKHITELKQAYDAGDVAKKHLTNSVNFLAEAIQQGEWDMMGNSMANMQKAASLDYATRAAYQAQQSLTVFNRELMDVGISDKHLYLKVENFGKFTDMFFDNLISDWIVQNRIKNTYNHLLSVLDKVQLIQNIINKSIGDTREKLVELNKTHDDILLNK